MVYVYSKKSKLDKYIGKKISVEEITQTLKDMGMDVKDVSKDLDPELKIELTAERIDMISTIGIARAIKYYLGLVEKIPKYKIKPAKESLKILKSASKSRPKTVSAIIRNIDLDEEKLDEIIEIQEKIHESFGRGRKKGAIGIYPIEKIKFPITYGSEKPKDIVFQPLESNVEMNGSQILESHPTGKKYAHLLKEYTEYPVFRDANGQVLSMPPIINSFVTGRVEPKHKDLFIECSGYNLKILNNILTIIITTLIEMGGDAQAVKVEYEEDNSTYELNLDNSEDEISVDFINKLIGIDITTDEAKKLFSKVMYEVKEVNGDNLKFEVPCYKFDVWHDVDVADDVARAYGYNNIELRLPNISTIGATLPFSDFKDRMSNTLTSLGFTELYTYILSSTTEQFKKMSLNEEKEEFVKLVDSADEGINMCRTSLLPETLRSLHVNRRNKYPQKVFENGFAIKIDKASETGAINQSKLCVSVADSKSNYSVIKGIMDSILNLNEIEIEVQDQTYPYLIEGRSAQISYKGKVIGFIGEVHPQVLTNFGLIVPVSTFEIDLEAIYNQK